MPNNLFDNLIPTNPIKNNNSDLYNEIYKRALQIVSNPIVAQKVTTDKDLKDLKFSLRKSDITSVLVHNDEYDKLLSAYTAFISKTLKTKRIMKIIFFVMSMLLILAVTLLMIASVVAVICNIWNCNSDYNNYVIAIISSMIPFVSTLMVIPKIIAKYLFNANEESTANKIVKNIQNYDNNIRKREEERDKLNQSNNINNVNENQNDKNNNL